MSAIITADGVRGRCTHIGSDVTDIQIESAVSSFTQVAEGYRGVRFGVAPDPDDTGATWVPVSPVLIDAAVEYVSAVTTSAGSGTSRDVIAQSMDGSWTRYSTPDMSAGRPTGWTEVDRLLNSLPDYRIPGFA